MKSVILRLIARGESAEIFKNSSTEALKLFYPGHSLVAAVEEFEKSAWAHRVYPKAPWMEAPGRTEGRISLRMELIRGRPLSDRLRIADLRETALSLGMMQRDLHIRPSEGLPRAGTLYEPAIDEFPGISAELRGRLVEWLRSRRDDRLCHGDFHPGNVLQTKGEWRLIRWREAFAGDPLCDIARSIQQMRSHRYRGLFRLLRMPLRRQLERSYLRGYFGKEELPEEELHRWQLLNKVLRFSMHKRDQDPLSNLVQRLRLRCQLQRRFL